MVDVHWSCKGICDDLVSRRVMGRHSYTLVPFWEDIPDFCIPLIYLKYVVGHLNRIREGESWSDEAFEKFKTLLITVYPFVVRDVSGSEDDRITRLRSIPSYLGGLGF